MRFGTVTFWLGLTGCSNDGSSYAHNTIAWAHLTYLSPKAKIWVAEAAQEQVEEELDLAIAYTRGRHRAIREFRRLGKSDEFIKSRINGTEPRLGWGEEMAHKGVSPGKGSAICTNEI